MTAAMRRIQDAVEALPRRRPVRPVRQGPGTRWARRPRTPGRGGGRRAALGRDGGRRRPRVGSAACREVRRGRRHDPCLQAVRRLDMRNGLGEGRHHAAELGDLRMGLGTGGEVGADCRVVPGAQGSQHEGSRHVPDGLARHAARRIRHTTVGAAPRPTCARRSCGPALERAPHRKQAKSHAALHGAEWRVGLSRDLLLCRVRRSRRARSPRAGRPRAT